MLAMSFAMPVYGEGKERNRSCHRKSECSEKIAQCQSIPLFKCDHIFEKMLSDKEFADSVGLPRKTVKNLQKEFQNLRDKEKDLQGKKVQAQREQMKLTVELLASFSASSNTLQSAEKESTTSSDELRRKLEEAFAVIESLQHEKNLIFIDRMVLLRENLTDEQLLKARDFSRKYVQRRKHARKGKSEQIDKEDRENRSDRKNKKKREDKKDAKNRDSAEE